jgi:hypothetical protein
MCATLERIDGHLKNPVLLGSTGRLFCGNARRPLLDRPWEHEVLVDPRKSEKPAGKVTRLWITGLTRNPAVEGLWEADIVDDDGPGGRLLRLNANPPTHLRPSRRARSAVTRVHEEILFPHGLKNLTAEPAVPSEP